MLPQPLRRLHPYAHLPLPRSFRNKVWLHDAGLWRPGVEVLLAIHA
jgi:hypothetical protein